MPWKGIIGQNFTPETFLEYVSRAGVSEAVQPRGIRLGEKRVKHQPALVLVLPRSGKTNAHKVNELIHYSRPDGSVENSIKLIAWWNLGKAVNQFGHKLPPCPVNHRQAVQHFPQR